VLVLLALVAVRPAPQLVGEDPAYVGVELGDLAQQLLEIGAGEPCGAHRGNGAHVGRTPLVGEDGAFADHAPGTQFGEVQDLPAARVELHPDPPLQDHEDLLGRLVAGEHHYPRTELADRKAPEHPGQFFRVKPGEEPDPRYLIATKLHAVTPLSPCPPLRRPSRNPGFARSRPLPQETRHGKQLDGNAYRPGGPRCIPSPFPEPRREVRRHPGAGPGDGSCPAKKVPLSQRAAKLRK